MKREPVLSRDVWEWPEFKAFATRLGVALDKPTVDITLCMPIKGVVEVHQTYLGAEEVAV